jgi:hypothetical protein
MRPDGIVVEFKGDLNQIAAKEEAIKRFGPGRIFRELVESVPTWEEKPTAEFFQSHKIPVRHPPVVDFVD